MLQPIFNAARDHYQGEPVGSGGVAQVFRLLNA